MFQSDYILRLVEQLAEAVARARRRREAGESEQFEKELGELTQAAFGMPLALLAQLPDEALFSVIQRDSEPDFDRLALLVRILCEHAQAATQGFAAPVSPLSRRALRLVAAMGVHGGGAALVPHREAIRALLARHESADGASSLLHDLWSGYEVVGEFAHAEDKLYALAAQAPGLYADAGAAFYRRLLAYDDDTLENGGLPRDEVQEGLERWQHRPI